MAESKDQQNLTKAIHRLVDVITKQQTAIGSLAASTKQSTSKTESTSKADPKFKSARQSSIADEKINLEIAAEQLEIEKELADLEEQAVKNKKSYNSENFKSLDTAKALQNVMSRQYDIEDDIATAKKKGDLAAILNLQTERRRLKTSKDRLSYLQKEGDAQDKLNKKIGESTKSLEKGLKYFKDPIGTIGDTIKEKITGGILKSAEAARASGKEVSAMGTSMKLLAGAAGIGLLIGGLKMAFERATHLNQELVDMQRGLGVTRDNAVEIHHALQDANKASKVLNATQKDYNDAFNTLSSTMGTNVIKHTDMLDAQVLLTKQMGMTNDEAKDFQMTSIGTGKSSEENLLQIKDTVDQYNKLAEDSLSVRDIQKDIAKSSKTSLANYKGDVKALTAAVIQAKKLGMTMAETEGVADSLLDFESSIEAEMKASVMTGQHINMNKARELALMGDTAGAAAEALKQAGSFDKFQKMDVLQKKAVAEAAGMTVEQIMKAGQLEKMNSKFGIKSMKNLTKEQQAQLVKEKIMTQEQIDQNIKAEQSASAQEKMNTMIDKMYTLFDKVASGPIEMVLNGISKMSEGLAAAKNFLKGMLPDWLKTFLKSDLAGTIGSVTALSVAVLGGIKVLFNKYKEKKAGKANQKRDDQVASDTAAIKDNTANMGGGGAGAADAAEDMVNNTSSKKRKNKNKRKGKDRKGNRKSRKTKTKAPTKKTGNAKAMLMQMGTNLVMDYVTTGEMPDLEDLGSEVKGTLEANAPALATAAVTTAATSMAKPGAKPGAKPAGPKPGAKPGAKPGKPGKPGLKPPGKPMIPTAPKTGGGFFSKIGGFLGKIGEKAVALKEGAGKLLDKVNPMNLIKKYLPKLFQSKLLGKVLGMIPGIGKIVSGAMSVYSVGSAASDAAKSGESQQAVGKSVIQALGSVGGSVIGGLLGTFLGPLGTMAGSYLGGMGGEALAGLIADNVDAKPLGAATIKLFGPKAEPGSAPATATAPKPIAPKPIAVKDALIRPGQPPVTFDKGDLIMAGTNLEGGGKGAGGGGGSSEIASLLKQLIAKVDQPVHVNIGGRVMDEIEKQTSLKKTYTTKTDKGYSAFG